MVRPWIRPFLIVAAVYDLVLGAAYFLAYKLLYAQFGVELPNHAGYVHLCAALIFIFGVGFWLAARDPVRNRDLIKLGALMKIAFAGVVFGHLIFASVPAMYVPFATLDLVFLVGLVWALGTLPAGAPAA
jgi:small multidrug resistance pump